MIAGTTVDLLHPRTGDVVGAIMKVFVKGKNPVLEVAWKKKCKVEKLPLSAVKHLVPEENQAFFLKGGEHEQPAKLLCNRNSG